VILTDGSGVSSQAKGNGSTSDTVETREKSAKSHVVQGKPTSNDANTEVHRVYLPSVVFLASPATLVIFSRFLFGENGEGGGASASTNLFDC
jgi:hypothetical protein